MPGQTIGTVNVQVGQSISPRVQSISYGGKTSLSSASDLNLAGATDGSIIVYQANTRSFAVEQIPPPQNLDGGTF
jgi:hypothetical protein